MVKSSFGYKFDVCIYFHNEPWKHRINFLLRAKKKKKFETKQILLLQTFCLAKFYCCEIIKLVIFGNGSYEQAVI